MTKRTYDIDLRDYDVNAYLENPIVIWNFNYNELPVGTAEIAPDKLSVEVTFPDKITYPFAAKVADMDLELVEGFFEDGKKELMALSVKMKDR